MSDKIKIEGFPEFEQLTDREKKAIQNTKEFTYYQIGKAADQVKELLNNAVDESRRYNFTKTKFLR